MVLDFFSNQLERFRLGQTQGTGSDQTGSDHVVQSGCKNTA